MVVPGSARQRLPDRPEEFGIVGSFTAGARTIVFAEQAPQVRLTSWNLGYCADRVLSFPRMLFGIQFDRSVFDDLFGFFLREPYSGVSTRLHHSILPNSTQSGWICVGNAATKDALMRLAASFAGWHEKTEAVIRSFWSTQFTDHVIARLTAKGPFLDPNLASLASWEAASRRDPGFVERVAWEYAGSVADFLRSRGVNR